MKNANAATPLYIRLILCKGRRLPDDTRTRTLTQVLVTIVLLFWGIALSAQTSVNISTGINTSGLALPIAGIDPSWQIAASPYPAGTPAKASSYYSGYWEVTPCASTNGQWINTEGTFLSSNILPGAYTFERPINVPSGAASLFYNLQVAVDDSLTSFELVRPNLSTMSLPVTIPVAYHLSNPITGSIAYPAPGTWRLRAKVFFVDQAAAVLVSGSVRTTVDSLCSMYRDDFSDTSAWVHPLTPYTCSTDYSDLSISGGKFQFNNANDGHFNYMYRTGLTIGNTWKAGIDFTPAAFGPGNGVGHNLLSLNAGIKSIFNDHTSSCFGGMTSPCAYPGIAPCSYSAQMGIGLMYQSNTPSSPSGYAFQVYINDGSGAAPVLAGSISTANLAGAGTCYPTMERTGPTTGRLSVYTNAARTIHMAGSPVNFVIPAAITGLNTVQIGVIEGGYSPRSLTGTLDNLCISTTNTPPTAVASLENDPSGLLVYPNPVTESLTVSAKSRILEIQVTGITGNLVYDVRLDGRSAVVPMSAFAPGLYLVKVIGENGIRVRKVIKN